MICWNVSIDPAERVGVDLTGSATRHAIVTRRVAGLSTANLVANVDGNTPACDFERRLIRRAGRLIGERDVQHPVDEPAHEWSERNRFTERHEVVLAIYLSHRRADAYHAVEVMIVALPRFAW